MDLVRSANPTGDRAAAMTFSRYSALLEARYGLQCSIPAHRPFESTVDIQRVNEVQVADVRMTSQVLSPLRSADRIVGGLFVKLVAKASTLTVGDPASSDAALGPLIDARQRDNALRIVAAAQQAGARIETGGTCDGLFFQATVLSGVTPDNPAFRQEIFGPVAVVVPFDTDDDAVRLANDSEYGLSAAIVSRDVGHALKLGERLRTSLLHINDQTVNDEVINPFGGVGASGNGTSIGGPANWEEFTQWQWLTVKGEAPRYPL